MDPHYRDITSDNKTDKNMKLKIFLFKISAAVALLLAGCSEENPWAGPAGEGGIELLFHASGDVETAAPKLRSGESRTIWVPEDSRFSVKLEKTDRTYSKTWASLDDFKKETSFKVGSYKLSVFYGTPEDQGYEMPYFYGEQDVVVEDGEITSVALDASLANAAVIVEYSDAFKKYFSSYKTVLKTEGSNREVEITGKTDVNGNMQEAYVTPGIVDVAISVTKPNGQGTTLSPAKLEVEAGHIYEVRYDVNNGEVGIATLTIEFDDSTQGEIVEIDLSEDLFTTGDPVVTVEGYEDAPETPSFETLASTPFDKTIKFNVVAPGTFNEAVLTVTKEGDGSYRPLFGSPLNLCEADETVQKQLAEAGVKAVGFFSGKDKVQLASLDMTGFTKALTKDGKYTIALEVKDRFTRTSGNIAIELTVVPMTMEAVGEDMVFGSGVGVIHVTYNGMAENTMTVANSPFRFEAPNEAGSFGPCTIASIEEVTSRSSFVDREYIYRLALPETAESKSIPVRMYYLDGEKPVKEMTLGIKDAPYTIETDAFAKRVVIRATENAGFDGTRPSITKYRINGQEVDESRISKDANGLVTITGLEANKDYTLTVLSSDNKYVATVVRFKTEEMADVPNGDFSQTHETINIPDIQVGGEYRVSPVNYKHKSSIVRSEANDWVSINKKTCYTGSANKNTWFMVPSTYSDNGAVIIRSVAYSHNGVTPDRSGGAFNIKYYCENAPAFSDDDKIAGELFLGTYDFNGTEIRVDGISFTSRPETVSFDYKYNSRGSGEKGYAYVNVLDDKGVVLGSGKIDLGENSEMTHIDIPLNGYPFGLKSARLQLGFKSTNSILPFIHVPSGAELNENQGLGNKTIDANSYHAYASGSELTVDNVKLNY